LCLSKTMKRFLYLSLLLHAVILSLFLWKVRNDSLKNWGGGQTGTTLTLNVVTVKNDEGVTTSHDKGVALPARSFVKPQKQKSQRDDHSRNTNAGSGLGNSLTPEGGVGSGVDGSHGTASSDLLNLIYQRIMRARFYPEAAKSMGLEGTSTVSFVMDKEGRVTNWHLEKSSGAALLDEEAGQTLKRAQPFPYYAGKIVVPIRFDLEE